MKTITLMLFVTTQKTSDGKKWRKYSTKALFLNEEHYIDVKFTDDAFKDSPVEEKKLERGKLTVDASCVGLPREYKIETDESGKKIYPVCWIRGGIVKFEPKPYQIEQSRFVCDEEETEEVEIG